MQDESFEENVQDQQNQDQLMPTADQPAQDQFVANEQTEVSNNNIQSPVVVENNIPLQPLRPTVTDNKPVTEGTVPAASHSPGLIVLQWLTYAFWGLTVIAMSVLTVLTLTSFLVSDSNVGDAPIYWVAAVLVLLPISVVSDIFYMKQEPVKKTGMASVVMIIHSVIFALFCIGALITAVFSMVNLLVTSSGTESTQVTLYSALIIVFLFALVFLRTILPKALFSMRRYFIILMAIIVGIFVVLSIVGPIASVQSRRSDKLIEDNLYYVSSEINDYTRSNKMLPTSLNDITLTNDAKKLITDNMVTYKNDGKYTGLNSVVRGETYLYQLCVVYTKASISRYSSYSNTDSDLDGGYNYSLSTYAHPAGDVCYKLATYL